MRWLGIALLAVLVAGAADALYLFAIWPDWSQLASGRVPKSSFIRAYEAARMDDPRLPPLRWRPVPLAQIAPVMRRVVVIAEDSRFWQHPGIDPAAIAEAMEHNLARGRVVYGASTLSQQTSKNLFLSARRDPLRKWHELVLTLAMERKLRKGRILELYLNVAEFGTGVYGVEAAARHYFDTGAAQLSPAQAVSLAASLPSPKLHNPLTDTRSYHERRQRIAQHFAAFSQPH